MTKPTHAVFDPIFAVHQVRRRYGEAVMAEVAAFQKQPGIQDAELVDRTDLPFVTIDNPDSRDLDQALYIETRDNGFVVYYALADGAFYIRPGSALFEEALARGASFYLPGICEPMLPRGLSEDLVSLNPGVDRRALLFEMTLDRLGHCTQTRLLRARVRSRAKLTYQGVQEFLDRPAQSPLKGTPYAASLQALKTVGQLRMEDARKRSVIRFQRSEIWLDEDATGFRVEAGQRHEVERYNEQVSLLCNIEGAAQ